MVFVSNFEEALEALKIEHDKIVRERDKLLSEVPKIIPLKEYPKLNLYNYTEDYIKIFKYVTMDAIDNTLQQHISVIEKHKISLLPIKEENDKAIENNKKTLELVKSYMSIIGIPDSYYQVDPKSKARYPKKIRYDAGYIGDLRKYITTTDYNYEQHIRNLDSKIQSLKTAATNRKKEIESIEMEKKQIKAEKDKNILIAEMIIKYNLDRDKIDTVKDIIWKLIEKNKYLRLGHYLALNRGDWNDGYNYAEVGLSYFTIENEKIDRQIYDCINDIIEDDSGYVDGRNFRDCEWNYDRLFGMVNESDPELYKDYNRCIEIAHLV